MVNGDEICKINQILSTNGYLFLSNYGPELSTIELANRVGKVLFLSETLPIDGIKTTQLLKPRVGSDFLDNRYSEKYGLGIFPLHTDLAYWYRPPRYLILRCLTGFPSVSTYMVHSDHTINHVSEKISRRAIFCGRRKTASQNPGLVPFLFKENDIQGIRWDSLFLIPVNEEARTIKKIMESCDTVHFRKRSFVLENPGDTLIIDNWKVLHGRTSVDLKSTTSLHLL